MIIRLAISLKQWLVTDRETHGHSIYYGSMASCSKTVYSVTYKIPVPTLRSAYLKISEQKSNTAWCWWFWAFNASLWRCWQQHNQALECYLTFLVWNYNCTSIALENLSIAMLLQYWQHAYIPTAEGKGKGKKRRKGKGRRWEGKVVAVELWDKGVSWPQTLEGGVKAVSLAPNNVWVVWWVRWWCYCPGLTNTFSYLNHKKNKMQDSDQKFSGGTTPDSCIGRGHTGSAFAAQAFWPIFGTPPPLRGRGWKGRKVVKMREVRDRRKQWLLQILKLGVHIPNPLYSS